ncbi:zinc finger protein on ecdysone puffs [Cloeon dipterum]|uniref:zinc finger protein on ecdysone puffs n=1 Tax=Cloeon dipterum TaxID=197152 RepID=UPI0032206AE9
MSFNNYGGGGVPNPWGNSAGNFQANPGIAGIGGFAGNAGINLNNLNTPQAQLAVGLISNLLTIQQQQQQQQQPPPPVQPQLNMMGLGGMGPMNSGFRQGGQGSNQGYSTRRYSPPRRRFRSPSPRRHQQARRPTASNSGKSYADNHRRMPVKRDHVGYQQNKKRPEGKNEWKKKPDLKRDDEEEKHEEMPGTAESEREQAQTADENSNAPNLAEEESPEVTKKEKPEVTVEEGKAEEAKKDNVDEKSPSKGDKKTEDRSASYEGLPGAAFRCHLCKKSMWDARSFDNHVRGIAHLRMLDRVEKDYGEKAKTLREACHAEEMRIQQDQEYQARMKNKPLPSRRDFCKMCDMVIYGSVLDHRRSSQHQALKNHLHPKCSTCQIDLPSRIDLDIHVLTSAHLKRLFRDMLKKPKEDKREETRDKSKQKKTGPVGEYDPDVAVGENYLVKVTGIFCELCRQFFFRTEESLKLHCKTKEHHAKVVAAQAKVLQAEEKEAEQEDSEKKEAEEKNGDEPEAKKTKQVDDVYDPFSADAEEMDANEENQDCLLEELEAEMESAPYDLELDTSVGNTADPVNEEDAINEEKDAINEEEEDAINEEKDAANNETSKEATENTEMQFDEELVADMPEAGTKSNCSNTSGRGRGRGMRRGRGRGRGRSY